MKIESKKIREFLILSILLLFISNSYSQDRYIIKNSCVGEFKIGMPIDELYNKIEKDKTQLVDLFSEGYFTPALKIYLDDNESETSPSLTILIGINESRFIVDTIYIHSIEYKTPEMIGVGSTLGELRKKYNIDWIDFGEGNLCARIEKIKTTFILEDYNPSDLWYKKREMKHIPDKLKIITVMVR